MDTKTVLIVTGSKLQLPAVRAARQLGYRVAVTDRDPNCACIDECDVFYPLDIYDVKGHERLVKTIPNLKAVFTTAAEPVLTVAQSARAAGLHYAPISSVVACSSKSVTRHALRTGGVPQPEHRMVSTLTEAHNAISELGASIVKATGSAGGRGHIKLVRPKDLTKEAFDGAMELSKAGIVLVEELVDGLEISVETLWYNGTMYPLNAVERPFAHRIYNLDRHTDLSRFQMGTGWELALEVADKYPVELGHFNPAMLLPDEWKQIWSVMEQSGLAVGLFADKGGHILKGDLIITNEGVKVLELALRLSGNWDSGRTSPLAHGVDYTMAALKLALGGEPDWTLLTPKWYRHAACLFKFTPPGKVASTTGNWDAFTGESMAEVILRYDVGDTVPPLNSYASLAAWVVADGATRAEAVGNAYKALLEVKYEVE